MNKIINFVSRETTKVILVFSLCLLLLSPLSTGVFYASALDIKANSYAIADRNTGVIYDSNNLDEQFGIASLTKLMSAYVVFEKIEENNISMDTMIPITDMAVRMSENPELSGAYFNYGDEYDLDTILHLMLIYSDNGATSSLATFLFGSESDQVKVMNQKAEEFGLKQTKFYNVTGLTLVDYGEDILPGTSPQDYNVSTAREMLYIAYRLLEDYPQVLDYVSQPTYMFNGYELHSYNKMLPGEIQEYDGVVGMKTGTSDEAGACFIGYYINPETQKEYLSVILGAQTTTERFSETAKMYDYVNDLTYTTLITKENGMNYEINGSKYDTDHLTPLYEYYVGGGAKSNFMKVSEAYNPKYFDEKNDLISDIPAGEEVVTISYKILDGEQQNFKSVDDTTFEVTFVTEAGIVKENAFQRFVRATEDFFQGLYLSI